MASDLNFVEFVVGQIENSGIISYKKMFGEYALYCNNKVIALICDNQLFVKPTKAGELFIGNVVEASAYPGAKPSFLINDQIEDRKWISNLIQITEQELPMPKLDLIKKYKTYYKAGKKPEIVEFGEANYLSLEGKGEPGGEIFVSKVEALYPLAYGIKKVCKEQGSDFGVPKLEGLWWVESSSPALEVPRTEWYWKLLIRMPEFVTEEILTAVQPEVASKKKNALIQEIVFEKITEGKCVQIMHIGPYSTEPETINRMMKYITEMGLSVTGLHHEIYLSDPRKTEPEKMKTLLRYPVK